MLVFLAAEIFAGRADERHTTRRAGHDAVEHVHVKFPIGTENWSPEFTEPPVIVPLPINVPALLAVQIEKCV